MDNFIMIPIKLLESDLSNNATLLLCIINSNTKQYGYAYGNNKYYAKLLKCSTRTITNLLNELSKSNYITIDSPRSFKRKIYVINF